MSEFDTLQEMADNAPEAGFVNINYGKLSIIPNVVTWENKVPTKVPLKKGQVLGAQESLELVIGIDIQELNPALEFTYERNVNVKKSGRILTDWSEIVEPSLVEVFGKAWTSKATSGPYVEVEDVPNVTGNASKKTGKVFTVPKILRTFKNKAECQAAREERFAKKDGSAAPAGGFDTPPDEIVEQVKGLVASVGADQTKTMIDNMSFGNYDPELLFRLVTE